MYLEAATAAVQVQSFETGLQSRAKLSACVGCVIAAPLLLRAQSKSARLQINIVIAVGVLNVTSTEPSIPQRSLSHLESHLAEPSEPRLAFSLKQSMQPLLTKEVPKAMCTITISLNALCMGFLSGPPFDGYCCHPAVVDSSFHLGALFLERNDASVRVPYSIEAFMIRDGLKSLNICATSNIRQAIKRQESVADLCVQQYASSNFGERVAVMVCGLEARQITVLPPAKAEHCDAHPGTGRQVYLSEWQANTINGHKVHHERAYFSQPLVLICARGNLSAELHIQAHRGLSNILSPASAVLMHVQSVLRHGRDATFTINTEDTLLIPQSLVPKPPKLAGIATWGMMRVAAAEHSNAVIELLDGDGSMPICHTQDEAGGPAGSAMRHGFMLMPMLLAWPMDTPKTLQHRNLAMLSGQALITGGLGGEIQAFMVNLYFICLGTLVVTYSMCVHALCRYRYAPRRMAWAIF